MAKDTAPVPTVPARNDLKKVEVYAVSRALELAGRDPESAYQYMSTDPANPSYYGKFLTKHEVGDPESGYATAEPWEFVSTTEGVTTGRPRDDQGKAVDTAVRHGSLVLMRTSKTNHAVYGEIEKRKDAAQAKRISRDTDKRPGAVHEHRFGYGHEGSHTELLKENA